MRLRALLAIAGMATLVAAPSAGAATFTVTTTTDGTQSCSGTSCTTIRAALASASKLSGADTIKLEGLSYSIGPQLTVNSDVTIAGTSAAETSIRGDGKSGRVFDVTTNGALTLQHASVANGFAENAGDIGGNIRVGAGTQLSLDHVRVTAGTSLQGGGIGINGGATVQITRSLIDGNNAANFGSGGAIVLAGDTNAAAGIKLAISDSTITGNTASTRAGILAGGDPRNATSLVRTTVASNSANSNDGGAGIDVTDGERFSVTASIISGNTGDGVADNCGIALTSGGGNVDSGARCGFITKTDLQNTDPQLGPPTAGLGETPVLPLGGLSPAIDLVPSGCTGADQRDLPRPQGLRCDAGAYEVDQPPDTTITSGPSGLTNSASASFGFTSGEPGVTFQCRLDGPGGVTGTFAACSSPQAYTKLADGAYTFQVRAVDGTGHIDDTPASRSFTVDTTPPTVSITGGPSGPTNNASPSFSFSVGERTATAECKLDGPGATTGTFAACTSPWAYGPLADGAYTFTVRATDIAGNSATATRSFRVDTVAPTVSITSGPSGPTNNASPSFAFTSEAGATFQCKLDAPSAPGTFAACASPKALSGLTDGDYTFSVRATDAAGNVGSAATRTFTVDTVPPDATIASGPSGATNNASPSFAFGSNDSGATFQCKLDAPSSPGTFAPCTSPKAYSGLANGPYTFSVRAIDAAGNTGTAATRTFTVDTLAPNTTIAGGPSGATNNTSQSFTFSSNEPGATFQCKLDTPSGLGSFAPCNSPKTYNALSDGAYTFSVRAIDAAGNIDGTPATRSFTVDTVAPNTTITGGPSGATKNASPSFTFSSNEAGATFQCKLDTPSGPGTFASCTSPKAYSALTDGSYSLSVRAMDAAGNTDATPATRSFSVDTVAPSVTITSGPTGPTNVSSPSFDFSAESGATTACRLDGPGTATGTFASCSSPKSYGPLADGAYTLTVRATDAAGNAASDTRGFTVDGTAPAAPSIASPAEGALLGTSTVTLSGNAEAGATVRVLEGAASRATATAGPGGSWSASFAAPDGTHAYTARATDAAGNTSAPSAARTVHVDTTPPPAEVTSGPSGSTSDSSPSFGFGSPDGGATFACRLDGPGAAVGTYGPCTSPRSFSGLAPGAYTFRVLARDAAGNTTETTRSFTVTALTPRPEKTVVVAPVSGRTLIKRPGSKRFVVLDLTEGIPLGSTLDTRHSRIRLSARRRPGKPIETALFYDGIFKVTQNAAVTELRLVEPLACPAPGQASTARKRRSRRLWGDGHGRFRTRGQYSSATVRGTKWLVQDSCGATTTKVARGVVTVRDLVKGKTVKVPAGHRYVARSKRR